MVNERQPHLQRRPGRGPATHVPVRALSRLRQEHGMTQAELADRMGLSVSALSALECGVKRPRPHTLRLLAVELGPGVYSCSYGWRIPRPPKGIWHPCHPNGSVGVTLRYLRRKGGLTQGELAEMVGVHADTISQWEGGWVRPKRAERALLASVLGRRLAFGWRRPCNT